MSSWVEDIVTSAATLGVQLELGSNILGQHHLSLQSMMDVNEEAISSLRNQAEKATESLLKNGTLDKSQTKCAQCNGLERSWKLWNWHGIDRFLEYCTCVNMAWCSSLRQRWIYNYGWWCELNNPFALPARPRITIGLWADNKSHRMLSHIELVVSSLCCRFNCGNLRSSHLDHGSEWCGKKQRSKCLLWRTCGQHQPLPSLHAIDFVFPSDGTMPYPLVWHQGLWNSKHQWGRGRFC